MEGAAQGRRGRSGIELRDICALAFFMQGRCVHGWPREVGSLPKRGNILRMKAQLGACWRGGESLSPLPNSICRIHPSEALNPEMWSATILGELTWFCKINPDSDNDTMTTTRRQGHVSVTTRFRCFVSCHGFQLNTSTGWKLFSCDLYMQPRTQTPSQPTPFTPTNTVTLTLCTH